MPPDDPTPMADALRRLAPQPATFSRDALLFAAGKAAAQPLVPAWVWPSATGLFASATVILGGFLFSPSRPEVQYVEIPKVVYVERFVEVKVPVPESPATPVNIDPFQEETSPDNSEARRMWQVRKEVLRWGVEMLPRSNAAGGSDVTVKEPNRGMFSPPGSFAIPGLPFRKNKPAPSPLDEDLE